MSIEFTGSLNRSLTEEIADSVLNRIKRASGLLVVREVSGSLGLSYSAEGGPILHENIASTISEKEIYVGFHAATRQQREAVIRVVKQAMETCGISCDLEEE
jgi:hypothetical protein